MSNGTPTNSVDNEMLARFVDTLHFSVQNPRYDVMLQVNTGLDAENQWHLSPTTFGQPYGTQLASLPCTTQYPSLWQHPPWSNPLLTPVDLPLHYSHQPPQHESTLFRDLKRNLRRVDVEQRAYGKRECHPSVFYVCG